ncbi:MAG: hypothetical protein WD906_07805 [Anaerolineales bacterium]
MDRVEAYLAGLPVSASADPRPVVFFNASTRISRLSLNAAFGLLASWSVRASGIPVRYWVCQQGMDLCVLGTDRRRPTGLPPCADCLDFSDRLFPPSLRVPLVFSPPDLSVASLQDATAEELGRWVWKGLPLGELCMPSLRWALRRHHLVDDSETRLLLRRYLISAASLAEQVEARLRSEPPRALVVFNGITYPEAVAKAIAERSGVRVITHEIGLRPFSAFFSRDHATFRKVALPAESPWTDTERGVLQEWIRSRTRGDFTMAGIRFWPRMQPIPRGLRRAIPRFRQMAAVFPNVIFDTSQVHANTIFPDMFAWLDSLVPVIRAHADTLFVVRAHPDEDRRGKESQEPVADWFHDRGLDQEVNTFFIGPRELVSSYELLHQAKLVLIYSSSVGLESAMLGKPVLSAGRARFSHVSIGWTARDADHYRETLEQLLRAARVDVPEEYSEQARRWLHYEAFHASLDLSPFLEADPGHPGMVGFRAFEPSAVAANPCLRVIRAGIVHGDQPFVMPIDGHNKSMSEPAQSKGPS